MITMNLAIVVLTIMSMKYENWTKSIHGFHFDEDDDDHDDIGDLDDSGIDEV